jgi:glycosyltransferase involved in cell wall biosynthesis
MNLQTASFPPPATSAEANQKPYLIILRGGPIWFDETIAFQAQALSPVFDGEFWYWADTESDRMVGSFRLRRLAIAKHGTKGHLGEYAPAVIQSFLTRRAELAGRDVAIVTYDPLIQGVIGAYLAKRLNAKLIVEFSGAYGNPANLAEILNPLRRRLMDARNKITGQSVVWRADGLRLLFEGQDTAFVNVPKSVKRNLFFDAINTETFAADPEQQDDVALFVGFPYRLKGIDVLTQAWQRIESQFPTWRLDLIGHELGNHIDPAFAARHRIQVHKAMSNVEVAAHMKRCGLFVLPSRSEGLPRVLLEAGAAGRARIATRVGGTPRAIIHDHDGLLVKDQNCDELAAGLARLMADKALRVRLGTAAQQRIKRDFSAENYLQDMRACISSVLGRPL